MTFTEIIKNQLIDKQAVARELWPQITEPLARAQRWYTKSKGVQGRNFSLEEQQKIEEIYKKHFLK